MAGGPIGTPWVMTTPLEKGREYHIAISCGRMKGNRVTE